MAVRDAPGRRIVILTNYAAEERHVALSPVHGVWRDMFADAKTRAVTPPRYGVAVLETAR